MRRHVLLKRRHNAGEPVDGKGVSRSAGETMNSLHQTRKEIGPIEGAALPLRKKIASLMVAPHQLTGLFRTHGVINGETTASYTWRSAKAMAPPASTAAWSGLM